MKKILTALIVLLVIVFAAAATIAGAFYKKAQPSLYVDLTRSEGDIKTSCAQLISPEADTQEKLDTMSGALTSQYWTSKWCLDSNEKALKTLHFDLTGYDFKSYLKALKDFDFGGFRGVASMNKEQSEIDIICLGGNKSASVVLYGFGKTKLAGKTLEIRIEEAVNKGDAGETVLPVVLRNYTASAADKLEIKLDSLDKLNTYHIEICEADKSAAPAYEEENPPVRYALSENKAEINIGESGAYCLDFIMKNSKLESYFEIHCDGKELTSAETFVSEKSASVSKTVKLEKGKHTLELVSEEPLPEFDWLVVSGADTVESVYLLKNKENTDKTVQEYFAYSPDEGEYSITSTEIENAINVNGTDYPINSIGAATVSFNKGYNVIKYASDKSPDLKITKSAE